ncbi:MAG: D-aminoacyl-tRNA deacylase [Phycisphaerae bacterium]
MRAVIQRVLKASVKIDEKTVGQIDKGLLVYLGVEKNDSPDCVNYIAAKIAELRIFEDENGKMNRSVKDINGAVLIVSNFTLCGNCSKGRRPGFDNAAEPVLAEQLYQQTVKAVENHGLNVQTGVFQEHMEIQSINDGPINFIIESN